MLGLWNMLPSLNYKKSFANIVWWVKTVDKCIDTMITYWLKISSKLYKQPTAVGDQLQLSTVGRRRQANLCNIRNNNDIALALHRQKSPSLHRGSHFWAESHPLFSRFSFCLFAFVTRLIKLCIFRCCLLWISSQAHFLLNI